MATATGTRVIPKPPAFWRRRKFQQETGRVLAALLLIAGAILFLLPLIWMLSTSLKGRFDVIRLPPEWIPARPRWSNYQQALTFLPFAIFFKNTALYVLAVVTGELLSSSFVAYGFARLRARWRDVLFVIMLSTIMLPYQVVMIPQYLLFKQLGWINSYYPLIVPGWFGSAFLIFLLRQFYLGIPRELDDAAKIDGCGYLGIWCRIILPLSKSALVAVVIFAFIFHYNNYLGPLIYIQSRHLLPVAVGLSHFTAAYGGTPWHLLMAASAVVTIPPVIVFFLAQRVFIQGVVVTGLKG